MSQFLYRLGSWSYRKIWPFLAVWLILLGALGFGAVNFAKSPSPTFSMPDMDSTVTQEEMNERFGSDEDAVYEDARAIRDGGGNGSIIGRNSFQRSREDALEMLGKLVDIYLGKA